MGDSRMLTWSPAQKGSRDRQAHDIRRDELDGALGTLLVVFLPQGHQPHLVDNRHAAQPDKSVEPPYDETSLLVSRHGLGRCKSGVR